MKTVLSFFITTLFANIAFAQSAAEVTCRAQAKETALQTYSSCITQARNAQVEQIRADYQKELAALKAKYDKELKGLNKKDAKATAVTPAVANAAPKKAAKAAKATKTAKATPTVTATPLALPAATQETSAPATTTEPATPVTAPASEATPAAASTPAPVAKLPEKAVSTEALPIQTVQEGDKVVAVEPAKTEKDSETQEMTTTPAEKEVEISALPQE